MRIVAPGLLIVAGVSMASVAHAQSATDRVAELPGATVSDVVVTANGYHPDGSTLASGGAYVVAPSVGPLGDLNDDDIPFSTLSIPQIVIADQQAHSAAEVLKNDPSVIAFNQDGRAQQYQVRGFNVGPTDGIYKDGLDLLSDANPAIEDAERVDVLRGAASVLFGFAAPGGIVDFQSKLPLQTSLTQAEIGFISGASADERFDANRRFGPGDAFGLRADIYEQDGDLDVQDTSDHRDVEALAGDWTGVADLRLWFNAEHDRQTVNGGDISLFTAGSATGFPSAPDPTRLYGQRFDTETIDTLIGEVGADYEHDGWRLHIAAGYSRTNDALLSTFNGNISVDQSGQFDVVPTQGFFTYKNNAYRATLSKDLKTGYVTQTFTLAVSGSGHIDNIAQNVYFNDVLGTSSLSDPIQFVQPVTSAGPNLYREIVRLTSQIATDKIDVGPYLTLLGGAVRSSIRDKFFELDDGALFTNIDQNKITPLAAVLIHPTATLTVYGSFIEALQEGAQAPSTAVNAFQTLSPYVGDQYEAGIKAEPLTGLELKGAAFRTYEVSGILDAENVFVPQGLQRNQGVEITATGKPLPYLTIFGGLTAINAGIEQPDGDYTRALDVPKWRANLYGELAIPPVPGLTLLGSVFFTSRVPIIANATSDIAAGYPELVSIQTALTGDVGVRYSWSLRNTPMSINAYASNITNAGYFVNSGSTVVVGAPRSVRISLGAAF